jgi:hypothetical protein
MENHARNARKADLVHGDLLMHCLATHVLSLDALIVRMKSAPFSVVLSAVSEEPSAAPYSTDMLSAIVLERDMSQAMQLAILMLK